MKVRLVKVYSDSSEVLYLNEELWLDFYEELDLNTVLRKLIGHEIIEFKVYYISSQKLQLEYANNYPFDLKDFKSTHLT